MAEACIPVDLFNPGQVFACLGLLEVADTLVGDAEGAFDWSSREDVWFRLCAGNAADPVAEVLKFLERAEVASVAPAESAHRTERWQVPTIRSENGAAFPYPEPSTPALLPARLTVEGQPTIQIDHWGDATARDNVKFWAGAGGYPGPALARDALTLLKDRLTDAEEDPFAVSAPQSSSFRFDWRRDYIPMEVGFSPNDHDDLTMVGFPLVEILAAIGLSNARPERIDKLLYRYGVIGSLKSGALLNAMFHRAALGCAELPLPRRTFCMRLGWPGQENQARCITEVFEEPQS